MRYFRLDTLGDTSDPKLAIIRSRPEGIGIAGYQPARGERIGDRYPEDARVYLPPTPKGNALGSLLGNTKNYLMVKAEMKEVIADQCREQDIEYLPFTLYDRKRRPTCRDCWIINPIGTFDCVNRTVSDISYVPGTQEVATVFKYVFDPKKVEKAPHLFRVPEDATHLFVSQTLARAFKDRELTNLSLIEIEQR